MERRLPDMSARLGELLHGLKAGKRPRLEGGDAALRRLHAPGSGGGIGGSPGGGDDRAREVRAPNVFLRGLRGSRRGGGAEHEEAARPHEVPAQASGQVLGAPSAGSGSEGELGAGRRGTEGAPRVAREGAGSSASASASVSASASANTPLEEARPSQVEAPAAQTQSSINSSLLQDLRAGPAASTIESLSRSQIDVGDRSGRARVQGSDPRGLPVLGQAALEHAFLSGSLPRDRQGQARQGGSAPEVLHAALGRASLTGTQIEDRLGLARVGGSDREGHAVLRHAAPDGLGIAPLALGAGAQEGALAERPLGSGTLQLRLVPTDEQGLRPDGSGAAGAAAAPAQDAPPFSSTPPHGGLLGRTLPDGSVPGGAPSDGGVHSEAGEGGGAGDWGWAGDRQEAQEGAKFSCALRTALGSSYGPRRKAPRTEEGATGPSGRPSEDGGSPGGIGRHSSRTGLSLGGREASGPGHRELARPLPVLQISPHDVAAFLPTARALSGADMQLCLEALYGAIASHNIAGAKRLEREILFSSSPLGNAVQRMGLLFLRGLKLRAAVGSSAMSNAELNQRLADAAPRITQAVGVAQRTYYKLVPLHRMAMAAACSALLDTFAAQKRIHIVSLGFFRTTGSQHWTHLIRGLGSRAQGPPRSLRFTFVGLCFNLSPASSQEMRNWTLGLAPELRSEALSWGIAEFELEVAEIGEGPQGLQELYYVEGRRDGSGRGKGTPRKKHYSPLASASPQSQRATAGGGGAVGPTAEGSQGQGGPQPLQCPPGLEEAFLQREHLSSEASTSWGAPEPSGSSSGSGREPQSGALPSRAGAPGLADGTPRDSQQATPPAGTAGQGEAGPAGGAEEGPGAAEPEPEGLGICSIYGVINLPDQYHSDILQWIGMQRADVFVVADMSIDQTATDPAARFQQCMRFYAPLLDLHDALLTHQRRISVNTSVVPRPNSSLTAPSGPRRGPLDTDLEAGEGQPGGSPEAGAGLSTEDEVFLFEQFMYTRHVNGCVGSERKMIHTLGEGAWQEKLAQLGLTEVLWEPRTVAFIRQCLQGLPPDLHLRAYGGLVAFCWRGQPLFFVGKWTGLTSALHTVPLALTL